jgi:hypothetical protein
MVCVSTYLGKCRWGISYSNLPRTSAIGHYAALEGFECVRGCFRATGVVLWWLAVIGTESHKFISTVIT